MNTFISNERIRLKVRNEIYIPAVRSALKRTLTVTDFTIISNNCWGGTVYEAYGLPKLTPTVGMFIMPADYLKFVASWEKYVSQPLHFIAPGESKWQSELNDNPVWGTYLIGQLGDVELHMQHYHDEDVARRKWMSRIKRINSQKMIFKFNDQNGASIDQLRQFDELPLKNKLTFSVNALPNVESAVHVRCPPQHKYIRASYEPIALNRSFKFGPYVNSLFSAK